jgi:hypothetical protein
VHDEQEFNAPSHEEFSAPNANLQLNIRSKIDIAFAIDGDIRGSAPRVRAAVGSSTKGGDRPPPLLTLYRKGNRPPIGSSIFVIGISEIYNGDD